MSNAAKLSAGGVLDEKRQWHTIYPQYINSNLTLELGRRLPKSKCIPDPRWQEIRDVLAVNSAKFDVEAFPEKCYCREQDKENVGNRGYVKYRLKDHQSFKNKREVLVFVTQLIPKLKSRQNVKAPAEVSKPSTSAAPSQPANAPSGGGGGGGGNKKKKGRR